MIIKIESTEQYEKLSKEGNVVVDFFATWCSPCRMMGQVMEEIHLNHEKVVFLKVDVDVFHDIASKFNVASIPTLALLKDGKTIDVTVGAMPKGAFERYLESFKF